MSLFKTQIEWLLLLKRFSAPNDQHTEKACRILLDKGFYSKDGGIKYWKTWMQGECCVTGMLLSMLCHFRIDDERIHRMVGNGKRFCWQFKQLKTQV